LKEVRGEKKRIMRREGEEETREERRGKRRGEIKIN